MRYIPVDTTRVQFIATGKAVARAVYAELSDGSRRRVPDKQETNEHGVPVWVLDVMIDDPDSDRAEIAGVKVAARDDNGPTTRLAVVAKAGTRYEPLPGLTVGLEEYAFKVFGQDIPAALGLS